MHNLINSAHCLLLGEPDLGGMDFSVCNVFIWLFSSKYYPDYII